MVTERIECTTIYVWNHIGSKPQPKAPAKSKRLFDCPSNKMPLVDIQLKLAFKISTCKVIAQQK